MTDRPTPEGAPLDALLRSAIDAHDDVVLLVDDRGTIAYANRRAAECLGRDAAGLAGSSVLAQDGEPSAVSGPALLEGIRQLGSHAAVDSLMLEVADGVVASGEREYSLVVGRNTRQGATASSQMRLMQFSIDQIGESVFWIGPDANLHYTNLAASRKLGYSNAEMLDMSVSDVDPNFPLEIWPLHWEELRERGHLTFETAHRRKDGHVFPVEVSANYLKIGDSEYNCAFVRDITERKLAEGKLQQMATRDPLTGLPNPTLFNDRIEQGINRCRRNHNGIAVLFIDLDRFRDVNLQHGREAGDDAIVAVARRLATPLRTTDTIARWSSDTFAVLVDGIGSPQDAATIAEKMLDTLHAPLQIGPLSLTIDASIGIACYPNDGLDPQTLCKNADIAMFRATEIGGNTIQFFGQSPRSEGLTSVELLLEMRHAIDRNELSLRYAPEMPNGTEAVRTLEAELCWNHPGRGPLDSEQFMEVAEETGYSIALGRWQVERACQQLAQWRDAGLELPQIAIGLTLRQLRSGEVYDAIRESLERHGLDAAQLRVILPTGLLSGPREQTEPPMERLRDLGVEMAIGGFGQTPTVPRILQSLPISRVRLDCDSTCGPGQCLAPNPLVFGLVALCHALGLKITLAGIDSEERLDCATRNGCDAMVGDLLAEPMDAAAATAWLAARHEG